MCGRSIRRGRSGKVGASSAAINTLSTPCPRSVRSPMKPSSSPATRNTLPPPTPILVKSATEIGTSAKDCASPDGRQSRILDPGDYQSEVSEVVGLSTKSVMHDLSKNEIREERDAAKDARRNL
jgi:hypothetical protein